MKFIIFPRHVIEKENIMDKNHVVISITCPDDLNADVIRNEFTKDILFLKFDDLDDSDLEDQKSFKKIFKRNIKLFNNDDAYRVAEFIKKQKEQIEIVVVQCDAGVSRSAGLAAALSKYYNNDDKWVFNSRLYYPNKYIYRKMLDYLFNHVNDYNQGEQNA